MKNRVCPLASDAYFLILPATMTQTNNAFFVWLITKTAVRPNVAIDVNFFVF